MSRAWHKITGTGAWDLAGGADGSIWHIGGNAKIYRWSGGEWEPGPDCKAVRVGADRRGVPWHIGTDYGLYRWSADGWSRFPGVMATELAIGSDGTVLHVGTDRQLYLWDGSRGWTPFRGVIARACAVDAHGRPWHIGEHRSIYYFESGAWRDTAAIATSIAAGADGSVYHTGCKSFGISGGASPWNIYKWNGSGWDEWDDREWYQVAVQSGDAVWARDSMEGIWRSP